MVLDPGGRGGEPLDERLVDQKALGQGLEVRILQAEEQLAEPGGELGDVLRTLRQEILGLDLVAGHPLDVREDDLQGPLEDLDLPLHVEEIARLERPGQPLARVPEPGADGA